MQADDAVSLDPAKAYEFASSGVVNQLYDKLVDFAVDDFTKPIPELAESWDIAEDGKTWIFHIRQGVNFASGNPVNADAVVFSLRRLVKLADTPSWVITQFGVTEESITKVDDYTMQIVLDQQYAPGVFLSCLAYTVGSIVDPQVVMEHEKDGDMGKAWLNDHSAGSGPYILEQWNRNESFVLKANENYWKGKPPFTRIIVRDIMESTNQMIMVEKGDVDVAWDLLPDQINKLKDNPDIEIHQTTTFYVRCVGMNVGYEPLGKSEVRDAIRYAIDYDGIVNEIMQGAAIKAQTFIPKGMYGYNPAMPYTLDLEKAKKLLADAGYPDGFDVELVCSPSTPWPDMAVKIQNDLAKIGINVKVTQMVGAQLYEKYRAQKLQMVLAQWGSDYVDPDANAKPFGHSNSVGDDAKIKQLAWRNMYVNLETSKLVDEGAQELEHEKRAEIYKKVTDMILDDGPFAILYYPLKQYAVRSNVKNFTGPPSFFLYDFTTLTKE
jgi:peptide/nickel transport system substrate-binding protein